MLWLILRGDSAPDHALRGFDNHGPPALLSLNEMIHRYVIEEFRIDGRSSR
jgi:hypothetical protein